MKREKKKQVLTMSFVFINLCIDRDGKEIPGSGSNRPGETQLQVEVIILVKLVSCV